MATLGSPAGNPGYSFAAPRYNAQTGQYEGGGAIWVGQGQPNAGTQQQFQNWLQTSSIVDPSKVNYINKAPQYGASMLGGVKTQPVGTPAPGPAGQPGAPAAQPGVVPGAPAGQPGALPQIPTGNGGFTTTNPTTAAGVPKYGLIGSEEAMQGGLAGGIAGINEGMSQAENTLSPYTGSGAKSSQLQAALSGALGPEAQRQAFAGYNESPEVAYQREMGEKAIMRNAAATGGLGGSRVQQELQRHAIGLAQQDYGNAFNRLGSLSDRGLTSSNLLGGLQANAGGKVGDYAFGTGQAMAAGRTRAGEQIAGNVQGTSASLAEMLAKQGNDLSSVIGTGGNNLASLLSAYGITDSQTQRDLAALLSNIATGASSTVAGASQLPGISNTGQLGNIGALLQGVGGMATGFGLGG